MWRSWCAWEHRATHPLHQGFAFAQIAWIAVTSLRAGIANVCKHASSLCSTNRSVYTWPALWLRPVRTMRPAGVVQGLRLSGTLPRRRTSYFGWVALCGFVLQEMLPLRGNTVAPACGSLASRRVLALARFVGLCRRRIVTWWPCLTQLWQVVVSLPKALPPCLPGSFLSLARQSPARDEARPTQVAPRAGIVHKRPRAQSRTL